MYWAGPGCHWLSNGSRSVSVDHDRDDPPAFRHPGLSLGIRRTVGFCGGLDGVDSQVIATPVVGRGFLDPQRHRQHADRLGQPLSLLADAAHLEGMSVQHRVPQGIPTGGQFAAQSKGESDLNLCGRPEAADTHTRASDLRRGDVIWHYELSQQVAVDMVEPSRDDPGVVLVYVDNDEEPLTFWKQAVVHRSEPTFSEIPDHTRVAMTQGFLAKAMAQENQMSPPAIQESIRQVNAEAHLVMSMPDHEPILAHDEALQAAAGEHIRGLSTAQRVPGRPGPMSPERAEQVANYFTERARAVVQHSREDLDKGPTAANGCVNESLRIVAKLRSPAASGYWHDAERERLRDELLSEHDRGDR